MKQFHSFVGKSTAEALLTETVNYRKQKPRAFWEILNTHRDCLKLVPELTVQQSTGRCKGDAVTEIMLGLQRWAKMMLFLGFKLDTIYTSVFK